jgi:Flp pilus assembly protein TadD/chromosome segregation ATPase
VRTLSAQLEDAKTRLQQSATPDPRLARLEELSEQQRRSQKELTRVGRLLEQTAAARDELLSQSQRDAQWRRDAEARERELQRVAESARRQQESAELELRKAQASLESLENANRELSKNRQENAQGVQKELEETKSQLRAREDQLQSAQMELLSAQRRLRQAEDSATRLGEELSQERIRSRTSADAVSDQLQSVGRLQAERAELSDQVERQKSALAASQELLSGLEASSRQREEELSAAKSRVAELEKALSGAREESAQAKESLRQIQEASPATAGILANARETQQESEELHRRQQEQETELVALREKLDQSESARARLEEQLTRLSDEGRAQDAAVWQERVQELQKSLEESQSRQADLEASLVRRSQEQRSWERELEELRKQLADAQKNGGSVGGSASGDGAVAAASSSSSVAVPAGASAGVRPETGVGEGGISASDQVLIRGFLRQALEAEQQGKREGARWNYQQALRLQPDNFLALKRLGLMASADGNDAEAAGFLSAALRKDPDDGEALLALGFAQLQLKQPEWSLATLARAAALVPREARTARLFGEALASMGWREAAAIQLKKAFELEEKDGEAAFNLAMLQLTRASELQLEARKDLPNRQALERLADQLRKDGLQWYQRAVALGIQEDPQLEKALMRANSPQ